MFSFCDCVMPVFKMSVTRRILTKNVNKRTLSAIFSSRYYSSSNQKNFLKSSICDVDIPNVHVTEFVMNNFGKWPNYIAFECGLTGRNYTYDEIRIKSNNLNKALRKVLKLQRRDVVAVLLPNMPEFPICVFGTFLAGLQLTTLNPLYKPDEIERQLKDANAKIIITISELWTNVKAAINKTKRNIPIIIIKTQPNESIAEGAINFHELINTTFDIDNVNLSTSDETIFMPYSSGTTGLPKGVELTSRNLVANVSQICVPELEFGIEATDSHQDVMPCILPLFHIYGFSSTALTLMKLGTKIVTLPKFTPETYLNVIIKQKPTILTIVPPIAIFLYTHPAVKTEYLQCVRSVMCGAAPLGALDEDKFRKRVVKPVIIMQGYGLSETSPVVTLVPKDVQAKYPGSMGHPIPNTLVKVIALDDPKGQHLGPNKTGELLVKGPQVMKGYHNRPEETKDAFLDGWFRTGDMVHHNDDGMFYIADRIKELIKVKGFQVPPAELEEIIRDFPGVADTAVIGIPHKYKGEIPRAYVVPKSGSTLDIKKIQEYVSDKVASYKRLEGGVVLVDSIPKNQSGKILRRQLKLKYATECV